MWAGTRARRPISIASGSGSRNGRPGCTGRACGRCPEPSSLPRRAPRARRCPRSFPGVVEPPSTCPRRLPPSPCGGARAGSPARPAAPAGRPSRRRTRGAGVPDQVDDVDRHPAGEKIEVLLDRRPPARKRGHPSRPRVDLDERLEVRVGVERGVRAPVDADDLGRHALRTLGSCRGSARITSPEWACISMKPGHATRPVASTRAVGGDVRRARRGRSRTRSPSIPTAPW